MSLHLRGRLLPDGSVRDVFVVDGKITFDVVTVLAGTDAGMGPHGQIREG